MSPDIDFEEEEEKGDTPEDSQPSDSDELAASEVIHTDGTITHLTVSLRFYIK